MTRTDDTPEEEPAQRDQVQRWLYELMENSELSLQEKQLRALSLSREYLDVANGHIQRRNEDGDTDEVIASTSENPDILPTGMILDRATTYCRRTVQENSPIALSNVPEQGWKDDPAYEEHGFECYLGTTIFVRGRAYGTVCFVSESTRSSDFTSGEKAFVELLARLLGRQIEAEEYETEITEAKQRRRESEDKHDALVQLAPNAIFLADPDSGAIVEANTKAAELTGYSIEDLLELTVLDMHPEGSTDKYVQLFQPGFDVTTRDRFDDGEPMYLQRADGSQIPVEVSLTLVELPERDLIQGIVRDISARREQERDLELRSKAMEETPIGITIGDAEQDDIPIVYANEGFRQLTGYSHDTVIGRNCRFLQGEGTDEATVDNIRAAIDAKEPIQTQVLNYRANGTPFWNKVTIAPVMAEEGGQVTHFVGIQEDVTAQNRREQLIDVLNRVLRHNIRNSVGAITGFASIIADEAEGDIAEYARRIERLSKDVVGLSNKAQDFQTGPGGTDQLSSRDIVSDIRTVVSSLETTYPETTFSIAGIESASIMATEQILLIFQELGENAAKYGDGSPVVYTVDTADEQVTVQVKDAGPGLPENERRVFETGQESPVEHGSGLGLWLVNWIVTSLGGNVTTTVDNGTTITVQFPTVPGTAEPEEQVGSLTSVLGTRQI